MSWNPFKFEGVALFDFDPTGDFQIALKAGEKVQILEEAAGWLRGYVIDDKKRKGIFPASFVEVLRDEDDAETPDAAGGDAAAAASAGPGFASEAGANGAEPTTSTSGGGSKAKKGTAGPAGGSGAPALHHAATGFSMEANTTIDALFNEIEIVFTKWNKQLFEFAAKGKADGYTQVRERMATLLDIRRQLMQDDLPEAKREGLRVDCIALIESSRRLDEGYMVPRRPDGEMADFVTDPIIQLLSKHREMYNTTLREADQSLWARKTAERHKEMKKDEKVAFSADAFPPGNYQLFLDVKACVFSIGEDTLVQFYLYSRRDDEFITEPYVCEITSQGMPKDLSLLHKLKTVFRDLTHEDFERDLYLVARVFRLGQLKEEDIGKKNKSAETFRRPARCAVYPLSTIGLPTMLGKEFSPDRNLQAYRNAPQNEAVFPELHRLVLDESPDAILDQQAIGIAIGLVLYTGEWEKVNLEHRAQLADASETCKLVQPYHPAKHMGDFFVTLRDGQFSADGKRSQKNVEVLARVFTDKGELVRDCIVQGSGVGGRPTSEFRSFVYYHSNSPVLDETFRINVPVAQFDSCHLLFTMRHCSSNKKDSAPFSFAVLPFTSAGPVVKDSTHELKTFKPHAKILEDKQPNTSYLLLDKAAERKEHLNVDTFLRSTRKTQNPTLYALFRWEELPTAQLLPSMRAFTRLQGQELVKYMRQTFDSLFHVLEAKAADTEFTSAVFLALLSMFDQLTRAQFEEWAGLVDVYVTALFNFPRVHAIMLEQCKQKLRYAKQHSSKPIPSEFKSLMFVCKCLKWVLRFIVKSRAIDAQSPTPSCTDDVFRASVREVFQLLNELMRMEDEGPLIGCKKFVLKTFAPTFSDLQAIFSPDDLGQIALSFIQSMPRPDEESRKLNVDKLKLIRNLVVGPVGDVEASRAIIHPTVLRILKEFLTTHTGEMDEAHLCVDVLKQLLHILQTNTARVAPVVADYPVLVPELLDVVSAVQRQAAGTLILKRVDPLVETFSDLDLPSDAPSCLWTLFYLLSDEQIDAYLAGLEFEELGYVVSTLMEVALVAIEKQVFPDLWLVMNMFEVSTILKILKRVAIPMQRSFLGVSSASHRDEFVYNIWQAYFSLCIAMIKAPRLDLEKFSPLKQDFMRSRYGDVREQVCAQFLAMWHALAPAHNQLHFVGFLVPALVELVRFNASAADMATTIYFDLLCAEYKSSGGTFTDVESWTIDALYRTAFANRASSDFFVEQLRVVVGAKLDSDPALAAEGKSFLGHVNHIYTLMSQLLDLPRTDMFEDERTSAALKLMDYLQNNVSIRKDMFFRYVQYLVDLHASLGNHVEAGMAQMQHIGMLGWNDSPVLPLGEFPAATERERKELLYRGTIDFFDQGEWWEKAIELLEQLRHYYQNELFAYDKLAAVLQEEAAFFQKIIARERVYSSYYRVCFYGTFEDSLAQTAASSGHEYIYRGVKLERVMEFTNRVMQKWPQAFIHKSQDAPNAELLAKHKQIISIVILSIASERQMNDEPAEENPFLKNRPATVANQDTNSNINVFYLEKSDQRSKDKKPANEFKELYVARTYLRAEVTFPCNRRRARVIARKEVVIHPVRNALTSVQKKNLELVEKYAAVEKADHGQADVGPLSMILNGMIDAAVNGGTKKYIEGFLTAEYIAEQPEQSEYVAQLATSLLEQIGLLRRALVVFGERAGPALQGLHAHLAGFLQQMTTLFHDTLVRFSKSADDQPQVVAQQLGGRSRSGQENPMSPANAAAAAADPSAAPKDPKKAIVFRSPMEIVRLKAAAEAARLDAEARAKKEAEAAVQAAAAAAAAASAADEAAL